MLKFYIAVAAIGVSMAAQAVQFKVTGIQKVPLQAGTTVFHPVFTPDGKTLLVTEENYCGLRTVDISSGNVQVLTEMDGAGYKPTISPDGSSVIVRENNFVEQTMNLFAIELDGKATVTPLARDMQHVNAISYNGQQLAYGDALRQEVQCDIVARPGMVRTQSRTVVPQVLVTEEDLKMVVYINGQRNVVDPVMDTTGKDVNYCWTSLSPNGQRLLFVAHNNAYTSNLDGSSLVNLGPIHAPVWLGNDYVVAMEDHDDGHLFTDSEIVVTAVDGSIKQQLTGVAANAERDGGKDAIKMFPAVSPDGNSIAYHTTDGEIYILNIEIQ